MIKPALQLATFFAMTSCFISLPICYGEQNKVSARIDNVQFSINTVGQASSKHLGIHLARSRQYKAAIAPLQQSIQGKEKADSTVHGMLGICFLNTGDIINAEYHFRLAVQSAPNSRDWQIALVQALMEQKKYRESRSLIAELKRRELLARKK